MSIDLLDAVLGVSIPLGNPSANRSCLSADANAPFSDDALIRIIIKVFNSGPKLLGQLSEDIVVFMRTTALQFSIKKMDVNTGVVHLNG